jgi:hypothetical protein
LLEKVTFGWKILIYRGNLSFGTFFIEYKSRWVIMLEEVVWASGSEDKSFVFLGMEEGVENNAGKVVGVQYCVVLPLLWTDVLFIIS